MTQTNIEEIKACIFDLDGVIVDSAKYHFIAWQEMAKSLGVHFSHYDNVQLKGVGRMESLDYILNKGKVVKSAEEKQALAESKNNHYLSLIEKIDHTEILEGVYPFLQDLIKSGVKIALGSSSKNAEFILTQTGIKDLFEVIIDGTKTSRSKPDPQVFQMGAKALNLPSSKCLVFEDAVNGVAAAKAGNFKCIGVGDWTNLVHADYVIPNFKDFTIKELARIY